MAMLNLRYLKKIGGVKAIQKINEDKAAMLYDYIDSSDFYNNPVEKKDRSLMNVPFVTPSKELDELFVKEAAANGLVSLKGHRLVGGMRASIYNAMPMEGVEKLVAFMTYLRIFLAGEYLKRNLFFFLAFPRIHEIISCMTPRGHITEQYTLPKRRVRTARAATTPKLSASTAGRNWIFAIHPSHA
jgi:hypothetical protein